MPSWEFFEFKKARVIVTIPTNYDSLYRVACVGREKAWIRGDDNAITLVDIHGSVQNGIVVCDSWAPDISVTKHGKLAFSDRGTVNLFRRGRIETSVTAPEGLEPRGICCTKSRDILVNLNNGIRNKIVRYQGQTVIQEIDRDKHGNPIFPKKDYMLYLSENRNGDICVSNNKARAMVVLDVTGRVRFRYEGNAAARMRPFGPRCIVTDTLCQIIVSDMDNDCLHVLDQDGNFLCCIDNLGLDQLSGLSVDSAERLWVGSLCSGEIKVIEYL